MEEQKVLFKIQCELALELDLPVIIHTRNSLSEALEVLDQLPQMPRGQFHCFSHDKEGVKQVLSRGFYVSFCGNIAWSKRVTKLVPLVPLDRLLLETDSPFMKPGERNESANVTITAQMIADL
ncbi:hydrolase TatD, partial [Candidatus Collierbacteria bacterium CG17_big_fil_post_rev_8_21_14_2_50_45_7]